MEIKITLGEPGELQQTLHRMANTLVCGHGNVSRLRHAPDRRGPAAATPSCWTLSSSSATARPSTMLRLTPRKARSKTPYHLAGKPSRSQSRPQRDPCAARTPSAEIVLQIHVGEMTCGSKSARSRLQAESREDPHRDESRPRALVRKNRTACTGTSTTTCAMATSSSSRLSTLKVDFINKQQPDHPTGSPSKQ